jgi:hypothetical protein
VQPRRDTSASAAACSNRKGKTILVVERFPRDPMSQTSYKSFGVTLQGVAEALAAEDDLEWKGQGMHLQVLHFRR